MTADAPSTAESLSAFANAATPPAERRVALTALITAKVLPKQADDPAVADGRSRLLAQVFALNAAPEHRLLSIAECIRLGQVVKRWAPEIAEQLRPAFANELPSMQLLNEADDRLNLARACALMSASWLPAYLARAIAEEETGEKARGEVMAALLARSPDLATALRQLASAFQALRPNTEEPGETVARRLARTLVALRSALLEVELEAGDEPGKALYEMLALPLSALGKPQTEKVQLDLVREALLTVHDIVRTRISVVADPQMYSVVAYCRRLLGSTSWPKDLTSPLERLITDVSEALILLGRQGQCDQTLLGQLDVLCSHPERARALARDLAKKHPELPEDVRDWLERGRIRAVRPASESAIEAAASNADESIGLALQAARRARAMRDNLHEPLLANLEIYEPAMAPAARDLLDRIQTLAVQVEQTASLRALDLYGVPGEEIEMSPKFFTVLGGAPRQRMLVKQPAIVRKRSDGGVGDVVAKGIVE
ncbi:hypothetical protein [Piscinibacter sp.]|uniref:hypothetical protein n=1 Tax=Piscinibacter sp. TaxID=1903157 RepID=UPI0039E31B46